MGYSTFTEEQITEFIETAQEMGIGPTLRYLGFPKSYHTAKKWFVDRNIDMPTLDTLAKMAGDLRVFYSDKEKIIAAQAVLDRCIESLMQDALDADALNKLANAVHKAIQIINEQRNKDGQDLAIVDLLNAAKARNNLMKEQGLKV